MSFSLGSIGRVEPATPAVMRSSESRSPGGGVFRTLASLMLMALGIAGLVPVSLGAFSLLEAREFGSTNQIIVQFSEAVPDNPTTTATGNYSLIPSTAKVTSIIRHPFLPEMVILQIGRAHV